MDETQFKERTREVLLEEMERPERWHYVSFAAEQFNGGAIVLAHGLVDALLTCHRLMINPGGEAMAFPIPEAMLPDKQFRNRLLSKEEIKGFWPDSKSIREHEAEAG